MRFPPSVDPKTFTIAAVIIGFALIDDLTANEQNSVGNWLMLVGQILETNAGQQQVIEERISGNTINVNGKNCKQQGDPYMHNPPLYNNKNNTDDNKDDKKTQEDIDLIKKSLERMQKEIDKILNNE